MKPNPYVYPFTPFEGLFKKNIRNNFVGIKRIDKEELKKVISTIQQPQPKLKGNTTEEKVLSIFQDKSYRFGPERFILENKKGWIEKLSFFTRKSQPIQFTILGFPFKMPVPLKTNRTLPDMGEVLALLRLKTIMDLVKQNYQPGAIVTIFTEGVFGRFTGVPAKDWFAYREFLQKLIAILDSSQKIEIIDLSKMESTVDNFKERFNQRIQEFKKLYEKNDPEFMIKYQGTYQSVYRIVSTKKYDEQVLMDVYNEELPDEETSKKVSMVRDDIKRRTHQSIFQYHAYLKVRDDLDFIQQTIPQAITLSVSPKPNRLGIIPVHKECIRLPYHGVTVYYPNKNLFLVEYLIDIKRRNLTYTQVFLKQDPDNKPFYYIARK